jgi:hypothetical protein
LTKEKRHAIIQTSVINSSGKIMSHATFKQFKKDQDQFDQGLERAPVIESRKQ